MSTRIPSRSTPPQAPGAAPPTPAPPPAPRAALEAAASPPAPKAAAEARVPPPAASAAAAAALDRFRPEATPPAAGSLPPGPQPALRSARSASTLPWSADAQRPPRDLVLPYDLSSPAAKEEKLLRLTEGKGALFAVGEWKPGARPLVLIHGINADFADLQPVVDRYKDCPDRQLLLFAYDDEGRYTDDNGLDLAAELGRLRTRYPWTGTLDIVAHSMGGVIARRALNEMTLGRDRGAIDMFDKLNFVAVDSPWHGFPGPGLRLPFFKGAMDMQAESDLFTGDSGGNSVAARAGLSGVNLPDHVNVQLVAADNRAAGQKPDGILDYTDLEHRGGASLAGLRQAVTELIGTGRLPKAANKDGDALYAHNFLGALVQDAGWPAAERELRQAFSQGKLDDAALIRSLGRIVPRYAGSHAGVLGNPAFLRDLDGMLR